MAYDDNSEVRVQERKHDTWYECDVVVDQRYILVRFAVAPDHEKWLALVLAKAVEAGFVDIDKLEGAFKAARMKAADDAAGEKVRP